MIEEFDKFYPKVWETAGTHVITIPKDFVTGMDLKVGDKLVVMIKKQKEKLEETEPEQESEQELETKHEHPTTHY